MGQSVSAALAHRRDPISIQCNSIQFNRIINLPNLMGPAVWTLWALSVGLQLTSSTPLASNQVQVVVGEEELPDDDILDDVDDVDDVPDYVNDNPVIEVDDTGTPVCPPLVKPLQPELCRGKTCRHDGDCQRRDGATSWADLPQRVCCFNGCIRTCHIRVSPPHFFDWPHDTPSSASSSFSKEVANRLWSGHQLDNEPEVELQGPDIVVTLPGGCQLTQPKYERFKLFQDDPNTRRCYCQGGGVYCQLRVDSVTNSTLTIPLR